MKLKWLYIALILPLPCLSQLDSLKGNVKSLKETPDLSGVSQNDFPILVGGSYEERHPLDSRKLFNEFPGNLYPYFPLSVIEKEYDKKKRLVKKISYRPNETNRSIVNYLYDEFGNLVQEKNEFSIITNYRYVQFRDSVYRIIAELNYDSEPEFFNMKQYLYNKSNFQLIEIRDLSGYWSDDKINYKYDSAGRVISEVYSTINRVLEYDEKSRMKAYRDSSDIYNRKDYAYNPDGTLKQTIKGCWGYQVSYGCEKIYYSYDKEKRLTKKHFFWQDSLSSRKEYQYNNDGLLQKLAWFWKEEKKSKNHVEYFYENRILTKAIFTDNDSVTTIGFQYKLDSHNNWIEQIKTVNNKVFYIRKREITYWD